MRRILLLDDEINVLQALQRTLRQCMPAGELTIEVFTDPEAALLRCADVSFDVAVSDYRMPGMNGIDFLRMVKGIQPDAVRLVLSASHEFETVVHAVNQAEVFRYIAKPWQQEELAKTIKLAFSRRDEMLEERRLADEARARESELSPRELEERRLEAEEPGITKVKWGADGSVQLE